VGIIVSRLAYRKLSYEWSISTLPIFYSSHAIHFSRNPFRKSHHVFLWHQDKKKTSWKDGGGVACVGLHLFRAPVSSAPLAGFLSVSPGRIRYWVRDGTRNVIASRSSLTRTSFQSLWTVRLSNYYAYGIPAK
jgi:hypothetical protein